MTVQELSRDQLQELKCSYYTEKYDEELSYGEIVSIDDIVSDEEVFDVYDATDFTNDDFFCSADCDEEDSNELTEEELSKFTGTSKIDEVHEGQYCYFFDSIINFVNFLKETKGSTSIDKDLNNKWSVYEGICTEIEEDSSGELTFSSGANIFAKHAFPSNIERFYNCIDNICDGTGFEFNKDCLNYNNDDIYTDDSPFEFTFYDSSSGEFTIQLRKGTLEHLLNQLELFYDDYDPDYETYLWLDETGHGKSGAPYSMRDILDNMEERESHLEQLINNFRHYIKK